MASKLQIHKPYVLQTLPRPLDRLEGPGRYHVSEVFGQRQGFKRRKRSELSVAVDGVAVYLYDILSSQPVTSYLVSPQTAFTCPPCSLRWRPASSKTATRYTYVSILTRGSSASNQEIRLFKEESSGSGTATVTSITRTLRCDGPITYIFASSTRNVALPGDEFPNHDLVAISADGTILCFHGETLEERWRTSPSVLSKELLSSSKSGLHIDFAQSTTAVDVVDGIFGGKNDLFGVFQEKVHRDGFNPDFLVLISSQESSQAHRARHLHILALPSENEARRGHKENVISVFVAPLPAEADGTRHQLDVRSGTLQVLSGGALSTYAFNNGIPRFENKLRVTGLASFLRLSRTSVLTAAANAFTVYNPIYRSLQASTSIDPEESSEDNDPCEFVTYLASREIAVGLRGTDLIAVQVEAPKNRTSKRRVEGLLADAIRRGISRDQSHQKRMRAELPPSAVLAEPLPGSFSDITSHEWENKVAQADELLGNNDVRSWEELLAEIFKVPTRPSMAEAEKATLTNETAVNAHLLEWVWPPARVDYARVDRRWVFYAISRVIAWEKQEQESNAARLVCRLPESSVLNYLVDAGHLSTPNIKSAFKDEVMEVDEVENVIGEAIPPLLAQADPTMELLVGYLSGTQLGPTELVSAIKLLLHSLDLFEDSSKIQDMRLGNTAEHVPDQENEAVNMELDRAEEELQITEHYLGGHRARGLGVAFSKLAACPAVSTVQSLRRLFKPEETIGLMNVLRAELIKDGWTTRYLDRTGADQDEIEAPPDGSIQLIADLMSRCIDSVSLGGWMASDTMLAGSSAQEDSADFFSQFQAEVSVALEGVMEAVRLQGALAEAVNFAKKARKALADSAKGKATLVQLTQELPLGLKADSRISLERVRSGAELVPRSSREIGHFVSKKRGIYSVHRISEETLLGGTGATVVQEAR
ncbi:Nucleoporin [Madurella fahalii]|uniref:Nucleoporin n=1 Tax=Madurella fahalii TaxID=1157608 RepID=A0ABQ0GT27_9PEZI